MKIHKFKSLYVHVPFCASKCGYCVFYSEPGATEKLVDEYSRKISADLRSLNENRARPRNVFIGGGTPTILPPDTLRKLLTDIHEFPDVSHNVEITVECNPETLSPEKAEILGHFANRISLGVQTFNRTHRHTLARRGTVDNIFKAVENLRDAGISNISADLIYGIPGQAIEELEYDLEKTLALGVNHISAYSLTFEEGSKLFEKMMPARYTDLSVEMWKFIADFLKSRGFERYEISNYARPGFECGHNLEIWRGGTYAGIGPAASSFDGISRSTEVPDIKKWLNATPPEKDFILPANRQLEIFVMGLRTVKGWTKESLNSLFVHEPPENIRKECRNFAEEGFIDLSGDGIRLTEKGLLFWDSIATELI